MIKRLNLLLLPAAFLFTTGAIFFPQGDQPAEAVYKNIKVFKGTPAKDILPAMQFMSASLKVNCGFCHAPGDFASDAKEEKGSARHMIEMQRDLNTKFFEGKLAITCNSCHNGHTHPTSVPSLAGLAARHKRIETTVKPTELFDKYVAAVGPEPKAYTLTGSNEQEGKSSPITFTELGSKFVIDEGEVKMGYDGSEGWHAAGGKVNKLSGSSAMLIGRMGRMRVTPAMFATYDRQAVVGEENVGDDACFVVRGTVTADKFSEEFYFDKKSGLLRRISTMMMSPLGRSPSFVDYDDYRDVAGGKVPFKIVSTNGEGETMKITFTDGKEATVDGKIFAAPSN